MIVGQLRFTDGQWLADAASETMGQDAQIVLVFGDRFLLGGGEHLPYLHERFPGAQIISCSSGGDILGGSAFDDGLVATAVRFDAAIVKAVEETVVGAADSERAGMSLARRFDPSGLRHVLVFAEGLQINGSSLARGLAAALPEDVMVSGGLAGDGDRFETTLVGLDAAPAPGRVVAIGFYGKGLSIGVGSFGGWEPFGGERTITRSEGNVLYELDGRRALDLYKELLGPLGYALPASGLSFPLRVYNPESDRSVVRTILGIDEDAGSMTFAGDVPQGWNARLLRSNLDQLIEAAATAAGQITAPSTMGGTRLAVAVSCIGRKLLLQKRLNEELSSVLTTLGPNTRMTGFYSYGELAPAAGFSVCDLHNQTMTLTVITEN